MSNEDPFADKGHQDKTVIRRPMPGASRAELKQRDETIFARKRPNFPPSSRPSPDANERPAASPPPVSTSAPPSDRSSAPAPIPARTSSGQSGLPHHAEGLLAALTQLNSAASHRAPHELKAQLRQNILHFQQSLTHAGYDQKTIWRASYILCTCLDEAILNTPWGHESGWARDSLLTQFHQDVSGGEVFFQQLSEMIQKPEQNIELLELQALCLSLGFEGQYRVQGDRGALHDIKHKLQQVIKNTRGSAEKTLSPHWRGVISRQKPIKSGLPLWSVACVVVASLGIVFALLSYWLGQSTAQAVSLGNALPFQPVTLQPPPPPVRHTVTLKQLLQAEIEQKKLQVLESPLSDKVVLSNTGLFASGQAVVNPKSTAVIERIAQALSQLPGTIRVVGHTDVIKPRIGSRYPSNEVLSSARAESVSKLLAQSLDEKRIRAIGKGASELLDTAMTREAHRRNRRVEIELQH